jgi:hypothetical protein
MPPDGNIITVGSMCSIVPNVPTTFNGEEASVIVDSHFLEHHEMLRLHQE